MSKKFSLGARSLLRLQSCHPHLQEVVKRAIGYTDVDFMVMETERTLERQKVLKAEGASKTLNSRHLVNSCNHEGKIIKCCHAVDLGALLVGKLDWTWELYVRISAHMKRSSTELRVPIVWGGDWERFRDGPHFELDWKQYPILKS